MPDTRPYDFVDPQADRRTGGSPTMPDTPHDVAGHFPYHKYPHPDDHTHGSPTMPDTLTPEDLAAMRKRDTSVLQWPGFPRDWKLDAAEKDRRALLRHIDALTAAVEALYVFPEPDSQDGLIDRAAVLAILRGAE
jgi:hypothetical protein